MNEPISYHFKPNPNLPTDYNPALRNHENFSYGGGTTQGPRQGQNPQQGYLPTTVKGIRSFLGHVRFYRRFIKDFSKVSRPLCRLLEKDTKFKYDES